MFILLALRIHLTRLSTEGLGPRHGEARRAHQMLNAALRTRPNALPCWLTRRSIDDQRAIASTNRSRLSHGRVLHGGGGSAVRCSPAAAATAYCAARPRAQRALPACWLLPGRRARGRALPRCPATGAHAPALTSRGSVISRIGRGESVPKIIIHRTKWRHCPWSRYDRHFVGATRFNASRQIAKMYRVIQIRLNQFV